MRGISMSAWSPLAAAIALAVSGAYSSAAVGAE